MFLSLVINWCLTRSHPIRTYANWFVYSPKNGRIDEVRMCFLKRWHRRNTSDIPPKDYWLEYIPFYKICKLFITGRTLLPSILCINHLTHQKVRAKLPVGGGSNRYFHRGPSHSCHGRKDAYIPLRFFCCKKIIFEGY
jgi:hypothetical protein